MLETLGSGGLVLVLYYMHRLNMTAQCLLSKKNFFFFFPLEISSLEQLVFTTDPKSTIEHDLVTTMSVKANIQNNGFWY